MSLSESLARPYVLAHLDEINNDRVASTPEEKTILHLGDEMATVMGGSYGRIFWNRARVCIGARATRTSCARRLHEVDYSSPSRVYPGTRRSPPGPPPSSRCEPKFRGPKLGPIA